MTTLAPNSYEAAVMEAHTIRGEPKALKDSSFISIFREEITNIHFAVRGNRAEALSAEGYIEVARMSPHGVVTKV